MPNLVIPTTMTLVVKVPGKRCFLFIGMVTSEESMQETRFGFIELEKGGACVGKGRFFLERLAEESDLVTEQLPGKDTHLSSARWSVLE